MNPTDDLRSRLNKNAGIALAVVGVILVSAFAILARNGARPASLPQSTWFTCDDGKTLFEDNDPRDIPPFEHDGGEAVQAYMIPGRTPGRTASIWYLAKFTGERKKQTEAMATDGPGSAPPTKAGAKPTTPFGGHLIKRPGDTQWIPMDDPKAAEIMKLPE